MHEFVIILALVLVNGFFAGAEIAVLSIRTGRLEELRQRGGRRVSALVWLRAEPERFLATVQVGITFVSAAAAAYGGASVAGQLQTVLENAGIERAIAKELALLSVVVLVGFLSVVIGELVPKSLALRRAERLALAAAPLLKVIAQLTHPLAWLLTAASNLVLRPLRDQTTFSEARLSAEEVQLVLSEAGRSGSIDVRSADIAIRALDLADLTALAVSVPRHKVDALSIHSTLAAAVAVALESGHARLPVFGETPDEIEGYVHSRDLLTAFVAGHQVALTDLIKQPLLVPWSTRAIDLLQQMKNANQAMALVTDEHGGLAGLVTFEDLVRELVGEIRSSTQQEPPSIQPQADGTVLLTGSAAIREVNRVLGRNLPESPQFTTVAGLCAATAGHIPQPPEEIEVARDHCRLLVMAASPQRVDAVLLIPDPSLVPGEATTPPPVAAVQATTGRWRTTSRGIRPEPEPLADRPGRPVP